MGLCFSKISEVADKTGNQKGDFLNSTTNLHMEKEAVPGRSGKPTFGGMFDPPKGSDGISFLDAPPVDEDAAPHHEDHDAGLRGPKNMVLNLKNVRLEGVLSSATAEYRTGLTEITEDMRLELSNITQTPAPTINNGVIVYLDKDSTWIVNGINYITSLTICEGALVRGAGDRKVIMTVDGAEVKIEPGTYQGKIVVSVR